MNQRSEIESVKARIRGLLAKTVDRGCTEAEAMAAAAKVGSLMEQYALSITDVEVRQERCVVAKVANGGNKRRPIDGCVMAIAAFTDTRVWLAKGLGLPDAKGKRKKVTSYAFFGHEDDTKMAIYLFEMIRRAIETETGAFKRTDLYQRVQGDRSDSGALTATISFQRGMARRISERLNAMQAAREASVAQQRSDGTALIVVKKDAVERAFKDMGMRLRTYTRVARTRNGQAFHAGRDAGDRVNLNNPLSDDSNIAMIG